MISNLWWPCSNAWPSHMHEEPSTKQHKKSLELLSIFKTTLWPFLAQACAAADFKSQNVKRAKIGNIRFKERLKSNIKQNEIKKRISNLRGGLNLIWNSIGLVKKIIKDYNKVLRHKPPQVWLTASSWYCDIMISCYHGIMNS